VSIKGHPYICIVVSEEDVEKPSTAKGIASILNCEKHLSRKSETQALPKAPLLPFDATGDTPWAVPFAFDDYLEMVDWTGRAIRSDKSGFIAAQQPKILSRLGIDGERFIEYADRLLKVFGVAVGAPLALVNLSAKRQTKFLHGMLAAKRIFTSGRQAICC